MKLLFKQRFFSWFDDYDIYDEEGHTVYTVKGKLSWGHKLVIYDTQNREVAMVQERVISLLPKFEIYVGSRYLGCIHKEFSLFTPKFHIDYNGWRVEGSFMEWDYRIVNAQNVCVAEISKELFQWTDTYVIDVRNPEDALGALMLVLAIDAEKCSRN